MAQQHPFCYSRSSLLFHVFVKRRPQSVSDKIMVFIRNTKGSFLLSLKPISLLVVICNSGQNSCLQRAQPPRSQPALLSYLLRALVFMSYYCLSPGPWIQCKLNIYFANDVKARVIWAIKPYFTVTSWGRSNKQGPVCGRICKQANMWELCVSLFLQR